MKIVDALVFANEKAAELQRQIHGCGNRKNESAIKEYDFLVFAWNCIRKEFPRKVNKEIKELGVSHGVCPHCENVVLDFTDRKRCSECGQALIWEDSP